MDENKEKLPCDIEKQEAEFDISRMLILYVSGVVVVFALAQCNVWFLPVLAGLGLWLESLLHTKPLVSKKGFVFHSVMFAMSLIILCGLHSLFTLVGGVLIVIYGLSVIAYVRHY